MSTIQEIETTIYDLSDSYQLTQLINFISSLTNAEKSQLSPYVYEHAMEQILKAPYETNNYTPTQSANYAGSLLSEIGSYATYETVLIAAQDFTHNANILGVDIVVNHMTAAHINQFSQLAWEDLVDKLISLATEGSTDSDSINASIRNILIKVGPEVVDPNQFANLMLSSTFTANLEALDAIVDNMSQSIINSLASIRPWLFSDILYSIAETKFLAEWSPFTITDDDVSKSIDAFLGKVSAFINDDYGNLTSTLQILVQETNYEAVDIVLDNIPNSVRINIDFDSILPYENGILGSTYADTLTGSGTEDVIFALSGNDKLYGYNGDDILHGGKGQDKLYGGNGNDSLYGGNHNDNLYGQGGNDKLFGDAGHDLLNGGGGNDRLTGGNGNDTLIGGNGNDRLFADNGNDTLTGGNGNDTFVLMADTNGIDTITDFSIYSEDGGNTDKLDLRQVIDIDDIFGTPNTPLDHAISDFIHARNDGAGNTILSIDPDGFGGNTGKDVLILNGIQNVDIDEWVTLETIIL